MWDIFSSLIGERDRECEELPGLIEFFCFTSLEIRKGLILKVSIFTLLVHLLIFLVLMLTFILHILTSLVVTSALLVQFKILRELISTLPVQFYILLV